jgi:short-subunit dehydrogenase
MNVLILGANSDIAKATAREFARNGADSICLAGRDTEKLNPQATDIQIRHQVTTYALAFDALNYESHAAFYGRLPVQPDVVICVFGYLGDQEVASSHFNEAAKVIDSNYKGAVSILNIVAQDFEKRKQGIVVGVSSVAGERGRQSNYIYGSAKAAFSVYLDGLRNRLFKAGAHVVSVKPGFVNTKMTQHLQLPPLLTAQPYEVAKAIFKACKKRRNTIYVRWMWRYIMLIIKNIPEFIFKRLSM